MYDKSWTNGPYTQKDVDKIGKFIMGKIQRNNGEYIATLVSIGLECGYKPSGKSVENYGGLFLAAQEAKKKYNIQSKSLGCKGNKYTIVLQKSSGIKQNNSEALDEIISIIDAIDLDKLSPEKSLKILRIIRKISKGDI
jgi:hypothetical protein